MVASTEQIEILEPEIVTDDKVFVAGRNWSSMDIRRSVTIEGHTIKEILLDALRREFDKSPTEFQESLWLSRCRCKVNGEEIEASKWDSYIPKAGEFVEFLVAPGKGGGGGKNILNAVLMVAVVAVAVITQQYYLASYGTLTTGTGLTGAAAAEAASIGIATTYTAGSYAAAGLAAAAVMTVGTYAVNKICPVTVSPQQAASSQGAQSSPTYSINGSSNSANPYGYVPLVLGRFRYSGPLGAKSWTKQIGDDQYFNMLVIWGHSDMTAKDFRIGETPLSEFKDVDHVFHGATTGNDLKYFSKSYNEQSVGAALEYGVPVIRNIGECDSISVDIYFPALADASSGKTKGADVTFNIEYALDGTENWQFYSASTRFFAPEQYIDSYTGTKSGDPWCTADGTWHVWPDDASKKEGGRPNPYISPYDSHWETAPLKRYKDKHKHHEWWFRDAWYDAGVTRDVVIAAASTSPVTRSFEWAVPHGRYKVRITRVSKDLKKDTVYDDATWSVARAIINRPAFNTPVPVCCSELRIRASEQLSGYVSDFNALCTSRIPMYGKYDANGELIKGHFGWVKEADENGDIFEVDENGNITEINEADLDYVYGETVNPADHLRYLLTSRHALVNPYTESKIDEASLSKFADYCIDTDYQFSLVCDSEAAAWNRLTAVASAGRGAITADNDGLFGVMIDNADKTVTQMFTPRNSWGFSIERAFYTLPHALRISFYDENDDYKQKEGFVYADGYNKDNATDIVEWSMTGKTRWEDNYRMGRYYLASIKLRPVTITLSTDWEWMMCRRGDVVGVSHDVLLNTFGTARVVALIYRDENNNTFYVTHEEDMPSLDEALPIGVRLDDTVIFSENASYGIAIRSKSGIVLTYQVNRVFYETADMIFTNSIVAAQCPYIGALASVSTLGNETSKYLVAAISVSDNNSAELTLVPWAMPDILNSEKGAIPNWEPPIYITSIGGKGSLPAPTIRDIKSDESMLKRSGNSLIVCMGVWWNLPTGIDPSHGRIFAQAKITLKDKPEEVIATNMVDTTTLNYIEFTDVNEGETYIVKVRLVGDDSGTASEWSEAKEHKVIGRTSKPDIPEDMKVAVIPSEGVELSWEAVKTLDLSHYEINGADISLKTLNIYTVLPVYNKVGVIPFSVQAVDVLGLKSDKAEASIEINPPASPSPIYSIEVNKGTDVSWPSCKTTWNIDHYEVEDLWESTSSVYTDGRFTISPRPLASVYRFLVRAVDIFGNSSAPTDFAVTIGSMPAPVPAAKVDGSQVVISWDAVAAPFSVEWYEVQSADGAAVGKVKSTELRFEALKAGTYNWRVRGIDIAGNLGPWGECSITLGAPAAPVLTVSLNEDLVDLVWTQPHADLPVVAYDVVRVWEETRADGVVETREWDYGRVDVQALSVPAMSVGTHTFMVRAVDNAGTTGPWGSADFVVRAPGRVTFFDCGSVDNNVMIYYTDPDYVFFPIREYLVEEIEDGLGMELGRTDAHFFADIRSTAGDFVYGITPVDVAGNLGQRNTMRIAVSPPPDFILFATYDSLFNGTLTNMVLDGKGSMLGPYLAGETWQDNTARIAAITGKSADVVTWQDKIDSGNVYWLSPVFGTECSYSEVLDVGFLVPQSNIKVQVEQNVLAGDVTMTCKIEVSEDGDVWRVSADDALKVLESSFQFVRVTLTWTGGAVAVQHIFIDLNLKRKRDYGTTMVYAKDCVDGSGALLPEESIGTFIPFSQEFVVLDGAVAVDSVSEDTGLNAFAVTPEMVPGQYLPGFHAALFDKEGRPIDGEISWSVQGV